LVVDNAVKYGVHPAFGYLGRSSTLVNNVIARSGSLASLWSRNTAVSPLTVTLIHNTIVGTGSAYGVHVDSNRVSLSIQNTIVASHTWGVTNTNPASCTVAADYTLFWSNGNDGFRGTNPVDGDPRFRNPQFGDYLLGTGSAAIDAGLDAGITTDIDGQWRPHGTGYDIGADEAYLPPIANAGPDQTVLTNTIVTLDGSGGSDPDGDLPLAYGWAQTGGPAVTLSSRTSVSPTFTAPANPAVLSFNLTVTDATGLPSMPDQCVVTVGDQPCIGLSELVIEGPPHGDAGVLYAFTAATAPPEASPPTTYTWSPPPGNGQGTPTASYQWAAGGVHPISLTAENCGGPVVASHNIAIRPSTPALGAISNPDGSGDYTVDWSDVPGAEFYILEEDDNPAFSTPITPYAGADSQVSITGQSVGTWYYRVRASCGAGDSDWSNPRSTVVEARVYLPLVVKGSP
jgi:hypothetical protein